MVKILCYYVYMRSINENRKSRHILYKSEYRYEYRYFYYIYIVDLQYTDGIKPLAMIIFSVSIRDLLLRDNLFEIITNSRTFYIQVIPRLSVIPTIKNLCFSQIFVDI